MNKYIKEICSLAIKTYGIEHQINKAIEEMAELTIELLRNRNGADNRQAIIEEIADVKIMLEQLYQIYKIDMSAMFCFNNYAKYNICDKLIRVMAALTIEILDNDCLIVVDTKQKYKFAAVKDAIEFYVKINNITDEELDKAIYWKALRLEGRIKGIEITNYAADVNPGRGLFYAKTEFMNQYLAYEKYTNKNIRQKYCDTLIEVYEYLLGKNI